MFGSKRYAFIEKNIFEEKNNFLIASINQKFEKVKN